MLLCWPGVVRRADAQDVYAGPVVGGSVLEHRDDSQSHGRLIHEVTVGRTMVAGALLDIGFTRRDHLGLEFLMGPYQNDVERSCVDTVPTSCTPFVSESVSWGLHYGMQYLRTFQDTPWRPYLGGGFGVKAYRFERSSFNQDASPTVFGIVGAERQGRHLLRLELRTYFVQDNPLLNDRRQLEMQVRAVWLFGVRR